ncbi:hypothetical protein WJ95_05795 [Burkholderia ubonensis]|uniref:DUF4019 domain-containing protein n=1 Tax=Burkholderia ubonensis TaxID=101571 RepID=UPI0007575CF7|nr:DUF4019 domain-containing protein [Burkholderia ubonensis]KVP93113.1 hypothetical protein WJ95_05795 [Burkholderia ubonensis]
MKKHLSFRLGVTSALLVCALHAQAEPGASADELLSSAEKVLQQLDSDQFDQLWHDAAPFVRALIPQNQFVTSVKLARHQVGTVARRGWASVTRIQYKQASGIPDGLYANVDFATTLSSGGTMYELVSFQLGSDGRWRLTGYAPRSEQGSASSLKVVTP